MLAAELGKFALESGSRLASGEVSPFGKASREENIGGAGLDADRRPDSAVRVPGSR